MCRPVADLQALAAAARMHQSCTRLHQRHSVLSHAHVRLILSLLQVTLQQTPETPAKLQGARDGVSGSVLNGTAVQQSHDGDVIFRMPNATEVRLQIALQRWQHCSRQAECQFAPVRSTRRSSLCKVPTMSI